MNAPSAEPPREPDHDAPAPPSEPAAERATEVAAERATEPAGEPPVETTAEPTQAGPAAGGSLRASDADRDQVAALLGAAYAEGRLTSEEHDERLEQVLVARTFDDLIPLTADLVPLEP